jgi:hypothetical protein
MNPPKAMGLGEPEVVGKKSLFQPPAERPDSQEEPVQKTPKRKERRVRTTLEVPLKSLSIIQEAQSHYRLDTGHPLPMWKIISEALALYEKMRKGDGSEK